MIALIACLALAASMLGEPPATERSLRVRAADTRSAALLRQGLERSETMRRLVSQLEQRDVIVYVEMQPRLQRRLAGTLTWVAKTPMHRYVRVSFNPELSTDLAIATLGHELQHALEVANAPEVVCPRTLERFYRLHGDSSTLLPKGWDTEAARSTGEEVRRELNGPRAVGVAESIQPLTPDAWLNVYRQTRGMLPP